MKKLISIVSLLIIVVVAAIVMGLNARPSDFKIKIEGDSGQKFSGSYMVVNEGKTVSKTIEGDVPTTLSVRGNIVSVSIQKKEKSAKILKLTIEKDNVVQTKGETWADFGIVSASTN